MKWLKRYYPDQQKQCDPEFTQPPALWTDLECSACGCTLYPPQPVDSCPRCSEENDDLRQPCEVGAR